MIVQVQEIVGLQQHVGKFGKGQPFLAFQTGADGVLCQHVIDREVLANIPHELDHIQPGQPVGVVHYPRRVALAVKVEEMCQLLFDGVGVGVDGFQRQEGAFAFLAGGVANHGGAAACQGDGMVSKTLQPGKRNQWHNVPHVQAVGGYIKAVIDGHLLAGEQVLHAFHPVKNHAAPLQFFKYIRFHRYVPVHPGGLPGK